MSPFLHSVVILCLWVLLASGAICLYRLTIGPDAADRAIALDSLIMVFISVICALCMLWSSALYFDAVWILTLVGYLGTVSIARYLERGRLF